MKPLNEEQKKMAEEHSRLIYSFLNYHHLDPEEYYGDMAEAYCRAIAFYDPSKSKLSTYVYTAMTNRLNNMYRKQALFKTVPESDLSLLELIPDTSVDVEAMAAAHLGWEQIQLQFSRDELLILYHLIYKDKSRTEMAKQCHMTPATYSKRAKEVKRKAVQMLVGQPNKKG